MIDVNKTEAKEEMMNTEFSDLDSVLWAKEAILELAGKGIINGVGDNRFDPNKNVTRAEFLKMLVCAFDFTDNSAECSFDDVIKGEWYYPYIATAEKLGITGGIGENKFGTSTYITRQEMAVMIHRAAVRAYLPVTDKKGEEFSDDSEIADWAKRSVSLMRGAGIINGVGDNYFSPNSGATRAQAAKMIYELYQKSEIRNP